MSQDEFTKLFRYMTTRFDKIETVLEQKADKTEVQNILKYLDSVIKRQEISDQERLVMIHQMDRQDRWTHELAQKIGYKLTT